MLANLRRVILRPLTLIGILCMVSLMIFHQPTSIYYYLTLAQLLFVPITVEQLVVLKRSQQSLVACGQLAVTVLFFTENEIVVALCGLIYLLSTMIFAWQGIQRFFIVLLC